MSQPSQVVACEPEPVTANTPSGIAGCYQWGVGKASFYTASGWGVAMNFCTWERRHTDGCGEVVVRSLDTGISVVVPVVDFCDCWWFTDRRVVDLQGDVVDALGLARSRGIWQVEVQPAAGSVRPATSTQPAGSGVPTLPDTAMALDLQQ